RAVRVSEKCSGRRLRDIKTVYQNFGLVLRGNSYGRMHQTGTFRFPLSTFHCMPASSLDQVVSLCKRRGFIFPGSDIYGGLANSWDYGPLGSELKNALRDWWWERYVHKRQDMVGLDAAIMMNPKVWEASGHVANFN